MGQDQELPLDDEHEGVSLRDASYKMPGTHSPPEVVYRALGMYLDYAGWGEIASAVGLHGESIKMWSRRGVGTYGYPWNQIRAVMAPKRAELSYNRTVSDRALKPWEEQQKEIMQDLLDARDFIMDAIKEGTVQTPKISDLEKIVKAQMLAQGQATQRVEMIGGYVKELGQIVYRRVVENVTDRELALRILELIAADFSILQTTGGDKQAVKKLSM
jgi:hypothetical protein